MGTTDEKIKEFCKDIKNNETRKKTEEILRNTRDYYEGLPDNMDKQKGGLSDEEFKRLREEETWQWECKDKPRKFSEIGVGELENILKRIQSLGVELVMGDRLEVIKEELKYKKSLKKLHLPDKKVVYINRVGLAVQFVPGGGMAHLYVPWIREGILDYISGCMKVFMRFLRNWGERVFKDYQLGDFEYPKRVEVHFLGRNGGREKMYVCRREEDNINGFDGYALYSGSDRRGERELFVGRVNFNDLMGYFYGNKLAGASNNSDDKIQANRMLTTWGHKVVETRNSWGVGWGVIRHKDEGVSDPVVYPKRLVDLPYSGWSEVSKDYKWEQLQEVKKKILDRCRTAAAKLRYSKLSNLDEALLMLDRVKERKTRVRCAVPGCYNVKLFGFKWCEVCLNDVKHKGLPDCGCEGAGSCEVCKGPAGGRWIKSQAAVSSMFK